jgi:hypothetical protein
MLDKLTSGDFSPHLNEMFSICAEGIESFQAILIAVDEFGSAPHGDAETERRRPFSIVLRGPKHAQHPQGIYRVEHEQMGSFDIFLVPIGPDGEGMHFEAVFN